MFLAARRAPSASPLRVVGRRLVGRAWLLATLTVAPALAHEPSLLLTGPEGLSSVEQGAPVTVRWVGSDSRKVVQLELYATQGLVGYWRRHLPDGDVHLTPAPLLLGDPGREFIWDTTGVPPGCYQPYTITFEPPAEHWWFTSPGRVTVRAPGAPVPPSVWISNPVGETVDETGHILIRYRVDDPDSATTVTLKYGTEAALYDLAQGLPVPAGGGEGAFLFDASGLEQGYYELYARVDSPGEPSCETLWNDVLYVPGGPYLSPDGGVPVDGGDGLPDAGLPPPPPPPRADAGEEPPPPLRPRTGCTAAPGGALVLGLWLLVRWGGRARRP